MIARIQLDEIFKTTMTSLQAYNTGFLIGYESLIRYPTFATQDTQALLMSEKANHNSI